MVSAEKLCCEDPAKDDAAVWLRPVCVEASFVGYVWDTPGVPSDPPLYGAAFFTASAFGYVPFMLRRRSIGYVWDFPGVPIGLSIIQCGVPFAFLGGHLLYDLIPSYNLEAAKGAQAPPDLRLRRSARRRLRATSAKAGRLTAAHQSRPPPFLLFSFCFMLHSRF